VRTAFQPKRNSIVPPRFATHKVGGVISSILIEKKASGALHQPVS
jgi:hypothetical protein